MSEPRPSEVVGWWAAVGFGPCSLRGARVPSEDWREAIARWDAVCEADPTGKTRKNSKVCGFSTRELARKGDLAAELQRAGEVRYLARFSGYGMGGGTRVGRL